MDGARSKACAFLVALLATAGLVAGAPLNVDASEPGPAAPGLTLTAAPGVVRSGQACVLTAHIEAVGATLQLTRAYVGEGGFTSLGARVTDEHGDARWRATLERNATYRVEFAGDSTWAGATADVAVRVRPNVLLAVTHQGDSLFTGDRLTLRVRVTPSHPGGPVELQRWDEAASAWTLLHAVTLGADSRANVVERAQQAGVLRLRARVAADVEHASGWSAAWEQRVLDPRNPYGVPTKAARVIVVDLSEFRLFYHEHGRIVRAFDCVLGRPSLPTPQGHFRIYAMDARMYGPYGPRRMRYLGAYAIHGTNEPWLLGRFPRNFSHGCTRLSNANILWLFARCRVGTPVWNVP
jgi:hypothetical protein